MTDLPEGAREKLVATKEAWARAGRLLTGSADSARAQRLPPGQKLVSNFPVLDLGIQPHIAPADWALSIDGEVDQPTTLDFAGLRALGRVEDRSDVHCVTQWSRFDNCWEGVRIRDVLELARPRPTAVHVMLHGYDGYTTDVALDMLLGDDCLLAWAHDGRPLSREHGGPVRAVIPRYYFWKSAKWLKRIELLAVKTPGFWETRGYHDVGDPWLEQRYG